MYDSTVWQYIDRLKPSDRNELEITALNNYFLENNNLKAHTINGWWADCGENFDKYVDACVKVKNINKS